MRVTDVTELVEAARAGDPAAADRLIATHLPLLYRITGRALGEHADVDDVVQEIALRAHRDLPTLRTPERFRSWLVAIAKHQISTRQQAQRLDSARLTGLEEAERLPDPAANLVADMLVRLGITAQRRLVAAAAAWLDPGDREVLSLWWREAAGDLSRADLADILGVGPAHARVRIQRMRQQLELCRLLVVAVRAEPRCPGLDRTASGWAGEPSPRWRKRFARHLRECDRCDRARSGFVPLDRLLAGAGVLSLPAATTSGGGSVVTGTAVGWFGSLAGPKAAAAVLIGASVTAGAYVVQPGDPPYASPPAAVASTPTATTASSRSPASAPGTRAPALSPSSESPGAVLIRPATRPGTAVVVDADGLGVAAGAPGTAFSVVAGIADARCRSLRAEDGRYVRHTSFRLMLGEDDGSPLFQMDATFCPRPGPVAGTTRLASFNYPGRFVRVRDGRLWLDPEEPGTAYALATSYRLTPL